MSVPTTTKLMTAEEFYEFVHRPENANRWFELARGEVIEMPPPMKPHGAVSSNVNRILGNYTFERGEFYVVSNDAGVILKRDPDVVRGPDVAVYDDVSVFEELHPEYGEVPPLLAVEVLSPNDRHLMIMDKINDYLTSGVRLVWVLDPEVRQVAVHQPNAPYRKFLHDEEITGESVLPGFRCLVGDFFRLPRDKPAAPAST